MSIIHVQDLGKQFRLSRRASGLWGAIRSLVRAQVVMVDAVTGVSFDVEAGELVGYLGPNGAGKSTTLKMLTGLLVPTTGKLNVNGFIPWQRRKAYVRHIGAVFGQRTTLWWDLPVIESLELLQHVYRVPTKRFRRNLREFIDLLEMTPFLDAPVRSLSLGQRMRADLCAALLHDPVLLFLDEPTIGLDVVAKERIRTFIEFVNRERGTTVMLTTHDLADVQKLCRRVLIIDRGRLLYDGSLDDLQARFGGKRELVVDFGEEYEDVSIAGADVWRRENGQTVYRFDREATTASALIGRLSQRYQIRDLSVREPDVEATIRRIYTDRLLEKAETAITDGNAVEEEDGR